MSAPQPDPIMRAVAEVMNNEEKLRVAADRELADELARLRERVDALDRNVLPNDLAAQLRSMITALAEPMPQPQQAPPPERVIGPPGPPGLDGLDGRDGVDGISVKGDEGPPGRDGVSIIA